MHIYVVWRVLSIPLIKKNIPKKYIIITGIILWAGFYLGRVFGHGGNSSFSVILELFGMNWMAILFLIFSFLLMVDLITMFGIFIPKLVPLLRCLAIITGILFSIIGLYQGLRSPVIKNYDVYLSELPEEMDGTVLVAISDLHIGSLIGEKWLRACIDHIKQQKPDMVVLLGDIFEGHDNKVENHISLLNTLSAPLGVWSVNGNHEFYGRNDKGMSLLSEADLNILSNSWVTIKPGFNLVGIDYMGHDTSEDKTRNMLETLPSGLNILLSHAPLDINKIENTDVDLMLSGHTHGGQIWPLDYLVKLRYHFLEGLYKKDNITIIVSRGAGTWGPRMRLWSPNEILKITLHVKGGS